MENLFLFCDLDRTLIPNGDHSESCRARPLFSQIANKESIILAYVTGRNKKLIREAIHTYDLPTPDYAVGDVGSTIYKPDKDWVNLSEWHEHIQKSSQKACHRISPAPGKPGCPTDNVCRRLGK